MISLITLSTPEIYGYSIITERNKRLYCERNGYHFHSYRRKLDDRHVVWSKIPALLQHMDDPVEWLWWLDADAMIMNPEIRISDVIRNASGDLVISKDGNDINAGSFLVRNSESARDLLRRVYARTEFIHHHWREQEALRTIIAEGGANVTYVEQRAINSYFVGPERGAFRAGDFILHLPAMSTEIRTLWCEILLRNTAVNILAEEVECLRREACA